MDESLKSKAINYANLIYTDYQGWCRTLSGKVRQIKSYDSDGYVTLHGEASTYYALHLETWISGWAKESRHE